MTTYKLNIDMDVKCPQCGKGGSVNGGICVKCAHKNLRKLKKNNN